MNLDWVIIGGGLHGVHLATRLIGEAGVPRERLRIVDEGKGLLERWRTVTAATGMTHLRSPAVHHLDLSPWSLLRFANKRKNRKRGHFAPPYDRPSLSLFNAHCDQVIDRFGLADLHVQARAMTVSVDCEGVEIRLSDGTKVASRHVVLAMGGSESVEWPAWAPEGEQRIQHVFSHDFDGWPISSETIAVVGGGISAGQVALRLQKEGHCVHLVSRHALRKHQFDSDPGWLGPKYMAGFSREKDVNRRRALIAEARHQGSVPPDVQRALSSAITKGQLRWHQGDVEALDVTMDRLSLRLAAGTVLNAERILLATGFASPRPGGQLVDELAASESLPCAGCGYPIVDEALRWHPRVYVAGPLAELELGPASRNLAGARRAGDRLVNAIRAHRASTARRAS